MKFAVKLFVGGKVFNEEVQAVNRDNAIDTAKAKLYEGYIDRPTPLSICRLKRETKIDDEDRECLYIHPDKSETKIIAPNRNGCPRNIYCTPR